LILVIPQGAPGRACVVSQLIPPYKVEFRAVAVKLGGGGGV
jgi:hypothetical protein